MLSLSLSELLAFYLFFGAALFAYPNVRASFLKLCEKPSWGEVYYALLGRLLGWTVRFYGQPWMSWRAFGASLLLAYLYPVLAAFVGYARSNNTDPAGLAMFPSIDNPWLRWGVVLGLIATLSFVVWMARHHERIDSAFDALSTRVFGPSLAAGFIIGAGFFCRFVIGPSGFDGALQPGVRAFHGAASR